MTPQPHPRQSDEDPMTTETARMFFDRALKAEAEVARLRTYLETTPYPSDIEQRDEEIKALRESMGRAYECLTRLDDLGPDVTETAVEAARMILSAGIVEGSVDA